MADDGVRLVKPGIKYEGAQVLPMMLAFQGIQLEQKKFV